jgi:hypothetical protein
MEVRGQLHTPISLYLVKKTPQIPINRTVDGPKTGLEVFDRRRLLLSGTEVGFLDCPALRLLLRYLALEACRIAAVGRSV